ncbi:MAG: amino acid ABC transporter permease [Deltaproteobacteria bacterium]|nr:MAG: amino acid ABC transporter permease [Deltaproteobacteria bacterium]
MTEIVFIRQEVVPAMARGLWMSIRLIVPSAIFGLLIGIVTGTLRVYGHFALKTLANIYVTFFRGFPLLVQLYLWYFGLARFGIYFSPYTAAVIGFSLCSGAYHSEYIRGALLSIKDGQMLGAQSLGFSKTQALLSIILPQAVRRALPGCGNELIYLIKYSSLAYMVTCIELTGEAKILASLYFKYMEMFLIAGAIYLFLVSLATWLLNSAEDRLAVPGFEPPRR